MPGYLNIDCDDTPPARPDLVHDVRLWLPFADGTVHEVRGDQFAEHLTLEELAAFLQECSRVLRVTVYVQVADGFSQLSEVADGASEILFRVLGEAGIHTRTSVGVAQLPKNAAVELDLIAAVD